MSSKILKGQILYGINNIYTVSVDSKLYECRIKGKVFKQADGLYNPLTTGDIVDIEPDSISSKHASILSLHERKNVFTRWNKKRMSTQLIAANIDILFAITTPDEPPFRPRFIDRLLLSEEENFEKIIILNKSDLSIPAGVKERIDDYNRIGIKVITASCVTLEGIEEIKKLLEGKVCVFAGQSGVGKSTLLNIIFGNEIQKTGEISYKYSRGRHVTNYSILMQYKENGGIIDTPGIREIFIHKTEPEKLAFMFTEFREFIKQCEFTGCSHIEEIKCGVKDAVEKGLIHEDRYRSYYRLYQEMTELSEEIYGCPYA
ncbi:MAG: ribosome small subunit-dependent GTPase A [Spirochaetes bacterium]|nr:ribosome small subunit-dependent GTPase A [Spirochaetota bacterium]